jgi:integration host factor subunit alpha
METRHGRGSAADSHINGSEHEGRLPDAREPDGFLRAALTKEELQNLLFDNLGISKRECREMVNSIFEEMRTALEAGETVKLEGFGRFQPKKRPKRWARNLRSGERIAVSERRVVTFQPSRKLTDNISRETPESDKDRLSGSR